MDSPRKVSPGTFSFLFFLCRRHIVVDRPPSHQVLSTRWVQKQRLDRRQKMRIVAKGFVQTVTLNADFYAGAPKLTTLRGLLTIDAIHGNPVAFGDCHSAFHQVPMPNESESVYVLAVLEAQVHSFKVWLCMNTFQGLNISPQNRCIHSTKQINDIDYDQLESDPSTYVKKRTQRHDDSTLFLHMDDEAQHQRNIS